MIQYAILSEDGYPQQLGTAQSLPEGAIEIPASADLTRLARMRLADGVWIDRPQPQLDVVKDEQGAAVLIITGAPAGTVLRVSDIEADELIYRETFDVMGQWRFPDAGRYSIEVDPPLPWLPAILGLGVPA